MDRISEHIQLKQPDKSGLVEHCLLEQHQTLFYQNKLLSRTECFWHHVILEALYIFEEPHAVNRDMGFDFR